MVETAGRVALGLNVPAHPLGLNCGHSEEGRQVGRGHGMVPEDELHSVLPGRHGAGTLNRPTRRPDTLAPAVNPIKAIRLDGAADHF
jgi:hypothetical protein